MKNTILKFSLYILVILGIHFLAAKYAGGDFDPFYRRLASGQYQSMIIGTSRAAQGIQPAILNDLLKDQNTPISNFAFTLANSSFGEVYSKAIQEKLNTDNTNNIFIIAVDPFALSTHDNPTGNPDNFREKDYFLAKVPVTTNGLPNFKYLLNEYPDSWGRMIWDLKSIGSKSRLYLHHNGWLEVDVPMDEASVAARTNASIQDYKESTPLKQFSEHRFTALKETITFFKKYGQVYLVRLPVHKELYDIEQQFHPNFDAFVCDLATGFNIKFWSFAARSSEFEYTDGNHLYKTSGARISKEIGQNILNKDIGDCQ